MKYFALLFTLLIGCNSPFVRTNIGLGHTGPIEKSLQPEGTYSSSIMGGAHLGVAHSISDNLDLDLLFGPNIYIPLNDKNGELFSVEFNPRLRYGQETQPYFGVFFGPGYAVDRWEPQATSWGFVLGVDLGLRIKFNKFYLTVGYRIWHTSNGSKVFGSPGPNPGSNMSMLLFGVEW